MEGCSISHRFSSLLFQMPLLPPFITLTKDSPPKVAEASFAGCSHQEKKGMGYVETGKTLQSCGTSYQAFSPCCDIPASCDAAWVVFRVQVRELSQSLASAESSENPCGTSWIVFREAGNACSPPPSICMGCLF